ncbi:hypothetical protein EGW08_000203 [Elysia chlorotica]|uniref:Uncharacterized protein n=1 Tax=Elysia chlorotica TaxID=188477 RepID=A0A3S1BUN9_ELYCH|nr:hypothetical protein EGW08_000203 [Elysia chlorotica]
MAAAAGGSTKNQGQALAGCNFVAQDQIWKDHVGHEYAATKTWPANWNFLTTDYEELVREDFPNREPDKSKREAAKKAVKNLIEVPPVTPIDKYITVLPSTRPVPKTTAGQVGWRSTDRALALEKYGGYAKPKGGLVKQLNWPQEGVD